MSAVKLQFVLAVQAAATVWEIRNDLPLAYQVVAEACDLPERIFNSRGYQLLPYLKEWLAWRLERLGPRPAWLDPEPETEGA